MTTGDFQGRPFFAGSLVGIRAFKVNSRGVLTGIVHEQAWVPAENEAVCRLGIYGVMMRSLRAHAHGTLPQPHRVAGCDCQCGFYAYFKGRNSYIGRGQVAGLVEGFGVCTVGSRGFRSEKARLVALIVPHPRRFPRLRSAWSSYAGAVRALVRQPLHGLVHNVTAAVVRVLSAERGQRVATWVGNRCPKITNTLQSLLGLIIALEAFVYFDGWASHLIWLGGMSIIWATPKPEPKRQLPPLSAAEFEVVRSNYPDVPVYPSRRAAVRAHPLTPPDREQVA